MCIPHEYEIKTDCTETIQNQSSSRSRWIVLFVASADVVVVNGGDFCDVPDHRVFLHVIFVRLHSGKSGYVGYVSQSVCLSVESVKMLAHTLFVVVVCRVFSFLSYLYDLVTETCWMNVWEKERGDRHNFHLE